MSSEPDKSVLLDLLKILEEYLKRKIVLVAAGGTAMTLLNLKSSTIDIDFTGPAEDIKEFNRVQKMVPHGHKIDAYEDGAVFSQLLPNDYLIRSTKIATQLTRIDLRALHPVDIVVTKVGRLSRRDEDDIKACIKYCRLTREEVIARGELVAEAYPANEVVYRDNLRFVVDNYFPY